MLSTLISGRDTVIFLVKNNSQATVSISATGVTKDASGIILGLDDLNINVLGPGEETIEYFYYNDISGIDIE